MGSRRAAALPRLAPRALLLLAVGLAPASACARPEPASSQVTAPAAAATPAAAPLPTFAQLEARLDDEGAAPAQRLEAVAQLGACDDPRAELRLRMLLEDARTAAPLRAAAVLALGRHSGRAALPVLAPLLADPTLEVREAAARSLGGLGGGPARSALEERLAAEESGRVREALQQSLTLLEP